MPPHPRGVVVCFCPAWGSHGGLRRSAYVVVVCATARRGSGISAIPRAAGVVFTTQFG